MLMLVILKGHGNNTHMTQSFSPERNLTDTMLRELSDPLHALDPTEYEARCHTSVTNNEYDDETNWNLLRFTYWHRDELDLRNDYEEMMGHLIEASDDVTAFIADYWGVEEDDMPTSGGMERSIAKYDGQIADTDYELTTIKWFQPSPHTEHDTQVLLAVMKSHDIDEQAVHLLYVDGILFDARKIPQQTAFDDFSLMLDDLLEPHVSDDDYAEFKIHLNVQLLETVGDTDGGVNHLLDEFSSFLEGYRELDQHSQRLLIGSLREAFDYLLEQEENISNNNDRLTADDVMRIQQFLKIIPLHEIDTTP